MSCQREPYMEELLENMAPKIFITGLTGYIGGDTFYALNSTHPDYEYTALVRTEEKANLVRKAYPSVKIVIGDLDNSQLLKDNAAKADVIIHTADASDHEGAARAIADGLVEGHTSERPGFWLHTGGTGILTWEDSKNNSLGEWSEKEYNDWTGVDELVNLPDEAFHRNVDKIVLETGTKHSDVVKTAIVCPPSIYGKGRGPSLVRGRQVYELAKLILTEHYTPIIGKGKARWNHIHVADISDLFVSLVDAAVSKKQDNELWGSKGYYFTERGEHIWGDLSKAIAQHAADQGYISKPEQKSLSKDAAMEQAGFEAVSWGLNSRGKGERAKNLLRWQPTRHSIEDEIPMILDEERQRLKQT